MKFIADGMVGGLARWLRLIGYDTLYFNTSRKIELIRESEKQRRIILTKDRRLKEEYPEIVYYVKGENTFQQFKEVVKEFNLEIKEENLFTICSICNKKLERVEKEKIKDRVPEYVYQTKEEFSICPECKRIYWEGDHCKYIREKLKNL